jgi:general stress protein YciG
MAENNKGRGSNQGGGRGNSSSNSGSSKGSRSNTSSKGTSKRGFASMDEDEQREIARKGGKASHGGGRRSSDD